MAFVVAVRAGLLSGRRIGEEEDWRRVGLLAKVGVDGVGQSSKLRFWVVGFDEVEVCLS